MNVLSGLCVGGPKDGTTLATMHGRRATHPGDTTGAYYHRPAAGTTPAQWLWVPDKKEAK
jgi:hypothetical protein